MNNFTPVFIDLEGLLLLAGTLLAAVAVDFFIDSTIRHIREPRQLILIVGLLCAANCGAIGASTAAYNRVSSSEGGFLWQ